MPYRNCPVLRVTAVNKTFVISKNGTTFGLDSLEYIVK